MEQDVIAKYRRIYRESTNALAKETAKKKLEEAGVPLTEEKAKTTASEPKKKVEPRVEKPKAQPKPKSEPKPKAEPKKPESGSKDPYDCDDLIKQAKERKAKAKANAEKRANAPKKTPATKNKEAVEKTTTRVEKSVESRAKKGEVKVAELEKLIAEYEEAIKKLKSLLSKVKSGSKFAKGGNMGMMDADSSKEYHDIKEHHCKCGDKKMAKGGNIGEELMGGQPNKSVSKSGYNLLSVKHGGKLIVVTDNDGKTKEHWMKSNNYSGYTLHYNGNQYEFAESFNYAKGGKIKERDTTIDREYRALKGGTRTSSKYASVEMRGGGVYHRRNANQYGKVKGGKTYTENRPNRTDAQPRKYLAEGGNIEIVNIGAKEKKEYMGKMLSRDISNEDRMNIIDKSLSYEKDGKKYFSIAIDKQTKGRALSKEDALSFARKIKKAKPNYAVLIKETSGNFGNPYNMRYKSGKENYSTFVVLTSPKLHSSVAEMIIGTEDFGKGGMMAKGGRVGSLSDFDINDLDNYERFIYDDMSRKMSKEDALQIIINNVEGDYTQLSPKLRRIAKKQ